MKKSGNFKRCFSHSRNRTCNHLIRIVFFVLIFLNITLLQVNADPYVSDINGTLVHDGLLTITGSEFGTKSTAAPLKWDTVDNQECYSALSDGDNIPDGGSCTWPDAVRLTFDTDNQRGQSYAHYYADDSFVGGLEGSWVGEYEHDGEATFMTWWLYTNQDWQTGSHSNKCLRFQDNSWSSRTLGHSWRENQNYAYFPETSSSQTGEYLWNEFGSWPSSAYGNWVRLEVWFSKTEYYAAINGEIQYEYSFGPLDMNPDFIGQIGINVNGDESGLVVMFDDIYVDSTQARVELCDSPSWNGRNHCEIQIPSAWGNNEITATLNQGSFGDIRSTYLYVVDKNGNVNEIGYPLSPELLENIPNSPSNLQVE